MINTVASYRGGRSANTWLEGSTFKLDTTHQHLANSQSSSFFNSI